MLLLHVIDDFVLQPVCLSKLKQRSWWIEKLPQHEAYGKYRNDYRAALCMHALSWSIMINLPLFLIASDLAVGISVLLNFIIHYIIDDLKANKHKINLQQDQSIHIIQIFITWILITIII